MSSFLFEGSLKVWEVKKHSDRLLESVEMWNFRQRNTFSSSHGLVLQLTGTIAPDNQHNIIRKVKFAYTPYLNITSHGINESGKI